MLYGVVPATVPGNHEGNGIWAFLLIVSSVKGYVT
jgi:hypothetical protein